jgi:hypothetical protein
MKGKLNNMKNGNVKFTAILCGLVSALALSAQAAPRPDGGPNYVASNDTNGNPGAQMVTVYSAGDVNRGKTGYFILAMRSPATTAGQASSAGAVLAGTYVKFSLSGTAGEGIDYVTQVSPAYVGSTGYAVISIKTLPDPRGSFNQKTYSVIITLEAAAGYAVSQPSTAKMLIKP